MWNYPKSALHQAAIDAMKRENDIATAKAMAAQKKLLRADDAAQALKDIEAEKVAVHAKTARLRAARLARAAVGQSLPPAKTAQKKSAIR
jgi:hypothetical protein